MRFITASGAVYDILDVEGEQVIIRDCSIPIVNIYSGEDMEAVHGQRVFFETPPTVGERFRYITSTHGVCVSTPVVSIEAETSNNGGNQQ